MLFSKRFKSWISRQACDHEYEVTQDDVIRHPFRAGAIRRCRDCGNPQIRLGLAKRFGSFVNISHWNRSDDLEREVVDMALRVAPDDRPEGVVRSAIQTATRETNNPISLIRELLRQLCSQDQPAFVDRNDRQKSRT